MPACCVSGVPLTRHVCLSRTNTKQGVAFEDAVMKVLASGGPTANATVMPEYVRLHDDKVTHCVASCGVCVHYT